MMSYNYQTQRAEIFTEHGQRLFLSVRDKAQRLLKESGAVMSGNLINGHAGDVWAIMACIDRLVELGELREIERGNVAGQHRIFVKGGGW